MEDIKEARKKNSWKKIHHDNYFCPLIFQLFEMYPQIKSKQGKLEIYVHQRL